MLSDNIIVFGEGKAVLNNPYFINIKNEEIKIMRSAKLTKKTNTA